MTKRILFLCFIGLTLGQFSAQENKSIENSNFTQENIFIHTNDNLFLTGEAILYKIYCFKSSSNQLSNLSKIAYIELIDSDNKSVYKQKLRLINGEANGDLFLQTSIKSGTYKLVGYTQWMRNTETFFEKNVFIVNPFSYKLPLADSIHKNTFSEKKLTKTNQLNISIPKKIFKQREKIDVNFNSKAASNISISVKKQDSISLSNNMNIVSYFKNFTPATPVSDIQYLPELRGELFKGIVTSATNESVENLKVGISCIGENKISQIVTTNNKGAFFFTIDQNYSSENMIAEVLHKDGYTVTIVKNNSLNKTFNNFPKLYLTEQIRKYIKQRNLEIQIENAYLEAKKSKLIESSKNKFVFNDNPNNVTFLLDDYTRFKTIQEVAVEILQDVWISKNDEEYAFHVRDANLISDTSIETLLIVDGYIVNNHTDFMYYDALKIKSINVVKEKYYFGSNVYQGIVNINTFKSDYKPTMSSKNSFKLLKPLPSKLYFTPNYEQNKSIHIPDMRSQLYWNPSMTTSTDNFSFFTSDVPGYYTINIQGILKDGTPINEQRTFVVK